MPKVSLEVPASSILCKLDKPLSEEDSIVIRPIALEDVPKVVEAIQESLVELKKFMPWAHLPSTLESHRARIIDKIHKYWTGQDYSLGIFAAKSNQFLGGTGLHARTLNAHGLEIGYWIRSSVAGKGIATQVTRALVVYGFEYLGLTRIQCGHNSDNIGSARVNDKCGFKIEGRFKNFETVITDEMRKNGWVGSDELVLRGLYQSDIPNLAWYNEVKAKIVVRDWLGQVCVS